MSKPPWLAAHGMLGNSLFWHKVHSNGPTAWGPAGKCSPHGHAPKGSVGTTPRNQGHWQEKSKAPDDNSWIILGERNPRGGVHNEHTQNLLALASLGLILGREARWEM